jgi:tRNA-uridine 2-sulfurtransferase
MSAESGAHRSSLIAHHRGERVLVAMSGGVDSSVAAALLKEQGYDVVGVTMRLFDDERKGEGGRGCCGFGGAQDAARVAAKLGFPHYTWDFRKEFETSVIQDFCSEYGRARTPNPCLRCNEVLKFTELLGRAEQLGAELIATGHYARIVRTGTTPKWGLSRAESDASARRDCPHLESGLPATALEVNGGQFLGVAQACPERTASPDEIPRQARNDETVLGAAQGPEKGQSPAAWQLLKGVDSKKDQSYFLYAMTQEQLGRVLMPVGGYTKTEVREMARKLDLPVAEKPESQDICFVPDNDYAGFLKRRRPELFEAGPVLDTAGKVLGRHEGIAGFTVGQRKGLGLAFGERRYVVRLDQDRNAVVLGDESDVRKQVVEARDARWVSGSAPTEPVRAHASVRYQSKGGQALVEPIGEGRVRVAFDEPQWAPTPGQAVVFWQGDCTLGGATIEQE